MEETAEYLTPLQATVYTAAISLLAVPTLYVLDATQAAVETETVLMLTGVVICALVAYLSYRVVFARLPPAARSDVYLPLFSLFAFTCIVDLMLALNVYGVVDCINWYLSHGEVYLNTNYGSAINFWDGIAHWALYIAMVWVLCHAHSSKTVAAGRPLFLYWVGSIMYCLVIFLPGATIGQHSSQLKLSSLLNMPYVFLPVSFCVRVLNSPRPRDRRHTPEYSTVLDAVLAIYFLFATAVAFLRFNACLGSEWPPAVFWAKEVEPLLDDPGRAFKLQGVISFYYMTPLYIYALYYLIVGGQSPVGQRAIWASPKMIPVADMSRLFSLYHPSSPPPLLPTGHGGCGCYPCWWQWPDAVLLHALRRALHDGSPAAPDGRAQRSLLGDQHPALHHAPSLPLALHAVPSLLWPPRLLSLHEQWQEVTASRSACARKDGARQSQLQALGI